jgi:hypothetical protein
MVISDSEILEVLTEYEDDRELVEHLAEFEDEQALREFLARHDAADQLEIPQVGGTGDSLYRITRTDERYNARFDIFDRTIEVI